MAAASAPGPAGAMAMGTVLLCCAIILSFGGIQSLSRSATAALLGLLFAMAYLFSPYWRVPCDAKSHALGPVIGNTATQVFTNRWLAIVVYEAGDKP